MHALSARPLKKWELTDSQSERGRRRRDRVSGRESNMFADRMESAFLLFLLAIFGFFLVGELTHMGACVLASPRQGTACCRRIETFLFSYFSVTKSYLRGVFPPVSASQSPPFFILFVLFGHAKKHYKASFFSKIKISFPILQEINR